MIGLTNNTICRMGGRIRMKCIRDNTNLFSDSNMCLALNPDFDSHTAKSVSFSSDFCQFSRFYLLKTTIDEILVLCSKSAIWNHYITQPSHILYVN